MGNPERWPVETTGFKSGAEAHETGLNGWAPELVQTPQAENGHRRSGEANDGVTDARQQVAAALAPGPDAGRFPIKPLLDKSKSAPRPQTRREALRAPRFEVRDAVPADIEALVHLDAFTFRKVYAHYDMTSEELLEDLHRKYQSRFELLDSKWMQVLVDEDGDIYGSLIGCPTDNPPDAFTSWEEATDNGTFRSAHNPDGKYLYVASMSALPAATKVGADTMMFVRMVGAMAESGINTAYFESRMPGFRKWLGDRAEVFTELDQSTQQSLAEDYVYSTRLKKTPKGKLKPVPHDRLLRKYVEFGCKIDTVVADAYEDYPSMNFGAVCTYDVPRPIRLLGSRAYRPVSWLANRVMPVLES